MPVFDSLMESDRIRMKGLEDPASVQSYQKLRYTISLPQSQLH